jgi:hypothetical protein
MVETFFEELCLALEEGDGVKLSGFGNFQLRDKPQRPGRQPENGRDDPDLGPTGGDLSRQPKVEKVSLSGPANKLIRAESTQAKAMPTPTTHPNENVDRCRSIPPKRYFSIGEVAELCSLKPHVLRYWEQEFTQLRPMKRTRQPSLLPTP